MNAPKAMLTTIQSNLNVLFDAIRSLSKFHVYDIDRNTDRFFCGLLNLIMDWEMVITDPEDDAFKCVQLIDPDAHRAVVIASSVSVKKLKHTLSVFQDYKLEQRIDHLFFFSSTVISEARRGPLEKIAEEFGLSGTVSFGDRKTIMQQIRTLPENMLPQVQSYLVHNHLVLHPSPTHLLPSPPPASEYFIRGSRDQELRELAKMLKTRQPIFLWGVGGIGKTQTVIQLAKLHKPPQGVYFISCIPPKDIGREILQETILAAFCNNEPMQSSDSTFAPAGLSDPDSAYQKRLEILKEEYSGSMLIIDNVDCQGKTLAEIQQETAYQDLLSLDLQLIFTTRCPVNEPNSIEISPLPEDMLVELMYEILGAPLFDEAELRELILRVARHTLTVVLMARTLADGRGTVTPKLLLDCLENATLNREFFPVIEWDRNEIYSHRQLYAHLSALFDISPLTVLEKAVMQWATLMPEDGLEYNLFLRCIPPKYQAALTRLVATGWLQKTAPPHQLVLHPVISEVCRIELKPSDDSCRNFLQQLWNQCDLTSSFQKERIRQIARCFSIASDHLADQNGEWACWAGRCWTALGLNQLALRYNRQMLELLQKNPSASAQNLATAHNHVGNTYQKMGLYPEALEHLKTALELREMELSAYDLQIASAYNNIGNIYGELQDNQEALSYHKKALDISVGILPPSHPELARSYANVGITYCSLQKYPEALEYLIQAVNIFERIYPSGHPDLARAYNYVGTAYAAMDDHRTAMDYRQKALYIFERVLPEDHPELARIYNSVGSTYSKMGCYNSALPYISKALEIREQTLPADHPDLAISYEAMADIYSHKLDYQKALAYAQKAMRARERRLPRNHPSLAISYQNVGLSYACLRNIAGAQEYLQRALEILRSIGSASLPHVENVITQIREVLRLLPDSVDPEDLGT